MMDSEILSSSPLVFSSVSVNNVPDSDEEYESASGSPVMWRPGSTHFKYNYEPMSLRAEEIAKGRLELLKLFEGLPDSAFELSLSDLVEHRESVVREKEEEDADADTDAQPQEKNQTAGKEKGRKKGLYRSVSKKWKAEAPRPNQFMLNIFVPKVFCYGSFSRTVAASPAIQPEKGMDSKSGWRLKPLFHSVLKLISLKKFFSSYAMSGFSKVSPKPLSVKPEQCPSSASRDSPCISADAEGSESKRHLLSRAGFLFCTTMDSSQDCGGACKCCTKSQRGNGTFQAKEAGAAYPSPLNGNRCRSGWRTSRRCMTCIKH
eukprot:TRINITY_DN7073_c0_g1_i1.p1 TRINITY_DN7073_c0_g1~~TRINITY_DN7073_c0_g1_i1.p1  ORF type:complete len:318 (-),score=55.84 TRINITY_DN7073_c0_g1_i1:589-1542(-)